MVCGPTVGHRGITTISRHFTVKYKEDPVVECTGGRVSVTDEPSTGGRTRAGVDQSRSLSPRAYDAHTGRKAVEYDKSIFPKLTPTLRAFTLEGKVAVVTG